MTTLTRAETARFLLERDRIVIVTHRRPDGDTLGSASLLCRGLRQLGKTAHVLYNPETTRRYLALQEGLTKPAVEASDTLVCVDVAAPELLPTGVLQEQILLRIDHHASATGFTPYALVDPTAAACGEILCDVLTEMGAELDIPMANALYIAVSTDTGCFRYANTTSNSFAVASRCAAVSPELFGINQMLFDTNSLGRLRLQGWLVEHALFLLDGQAVICALPRSVEEDLQLTEEDMENISGFPRSIEGVKISAMLRQETGRVKLSVRAVPGWDAAAVCAAFGGGGHKGAAGATLRMSMEDAVTALKAEFLKTER
jgi:phosphoesterase RecJ-like protein